MRGLRLVLLIFFPLCYGEPVALILARGGSKGVRQKNLQSIGGISLVRRAVQIAKRAGLRDVTVSTDHPLIALEGLRSGASIFHRSRITATDWAPSIWGAAEFLSRKPEADVLILIQATSPFIRPENIRRALQKIYVPRAYDCVFSVTRSYKLRWQINSKGKTVPINFNIEARPRRQDWSGELLETGAFYIARKLLIEAGKFQNNNCTVVETSSTETFEVDSYHDLQLANVLLTSNLV